MIAVIKIAVDGILLTGLGFLKTIAVVLEAPGRLALSELDLDAPGAADVLVDIDWSGISTGTERLLWSGQMPSFPGMGYPLVPGYESIGRVAIAGSESGHREGERVFVPGGNCYGAVKGLFGGASRQIVAKGARVVPIDEALAERGVLMALAATAYHAIAPDDPATVFPDLIVGHGVLGRLIARLCVALGAAPPTVWERQSARRGDAQGYDVVAPEDDTRRDYQSIIDVSGDASILDTVIGRLGKRGEIVLAGFYSDPLSFSFAPAFMREARIRIAAEWQPSDLAAVNALAGQGRLSLDGLITHCHQAGEAETAYRTAFEDPACLKMILDWRAVQ